MRSGEGRGARLGAAAPAARSQAEPGEIGGTALAGEGSSNRSWRQMSVRKCRLSDGTSVPRSHGFVSRSAPEHENPRSHEFIPPESTQIAHAVPTISASWGRAPMAADSPAGSPANR